MGNKKWNLRGRRMKPQRHPRRELCRGQRENGNARRNRFELRHILNNDGVFVARTLRIRPAGKVRATAFDRRGGRRSMRTTGVWMRASIGSSGYCVGALALHRFVQSERQHQRYCKYDPVQRSHHSINSPQTALCKVKFSLDKMPQKFRGELFTLMASALAMLRVSHGQLSRYLRLANLAQNRASPIPTENNF
jgi:hypothetical protein